MRRVDILSRRVALGIAAVLLSACVSNPAPKNWLKPAPESESDPYGAWIELFQAGRQPAMVGEFLALDHDSVYVLNPRGVVVTMPAAEVARARIAFYNAKNPDLFAWNTLGLLSTPSHGGFLILTAPLLWGAFGSGVVASNSRMPIVDVKTPPEWAAAAKYARFPAGLPAGLPRTLPAKQ